MGSRAITGNRAATRLQIIPLTIPIPPLITPPLTIPLLTTPIPPITLHPAIRRIIRATVPPTTRLTLQKITPRMGHPGLNRGTRGAMAISLAILATLVIPATNLARHRTKISSSPNLSRKLVRKILT